MRRAALTLVVLVCGSLTGGPAPVAAARAIDASAARAARSRDDASLLVVQRRASGPAARVLGRHGDPRTGAPPAVALPIDRQAPSSPSLAPCRPISPPPALAGQASSRPGLARGPPPR